MSVPSGMSEEAAVKGVELRLDTVIKALQTRLPADTTIMIAAVAMRVADVIKKAEALDQPYKDERAARALIRKLRASRKSDDKAGKNFLADVKVGLQASVVGRLSEDLAEFGFSPPHPPKPLTVEAKTLRAAKAKLTRELRGTKGKRQKAALKAGDVPDESARPSTPAPASAKMATE